MESCPLKTALKVNVSSKIFVYVFAIQFQGKLVPRGKKVKKELVFFTEIVSCFELVIPETRKSSDGPRLQTPAIR